MLTRATLPPLPPRCRGERESAKLMTLFDSHHTRSPWRPFNRRPKVLGKIVFILDFLHPILFTSPRALVDRVGLVNDPSSLRVIYMQALLLVKHRMNCSRYLILSVKLRLEGEYDEGKD